MEKSVQLVETIMAAKNNHESLHVKKADVVEEEIAKGEQDDLLEDYSKSKRERLQKLRSKTLASRIKKVNIILYFAHNMWTKMCYIILL